MKSAFFRKLVTAICAFGVPSVLARWLLGLLGHQMSRSSRIGFSIVWVDQLYLGIEARIGHFNVIRCRRVVLAKQAYVGTMNYIRGPFSVWLGEQAAIGNRNVVTRPAIPIAYGPAVLHLGTLSKITASHSIDCMKSIRFGSYSTLAGKSSQLWTHSYYHAPSGPDRFRLDGKISIGDNVYIGSATVITAGVTIGNGIAIGAQCAVASDLTESGVYVSQPLRRIPLDYELRQERLRKIEVSAVELTYGKGHRGSS